MLAPPTVGSWTITSLAEGERCLGVAVVDPSELVCEYPTTGTSLSS
jgi:hypothetical protein